MRVLIVEDDPTLGPAIASMLGHEGITAHVLEDAELALQYLRSVECDLLLVDMHLREMSGAQMIRVLRRAGVHIPAILMSGASDDEIAAAAAFSAIYTEQGERIEGANMWIAKPIGAASLLEAIEELFARRSTIPPELPTTRR